MSNHHQIRPDVPVRRRLGSLLGALLAVAIMATACGGAERPELSTEAIAQAPTTAIPGLPAGAGENPADQNPADQNPADQNPADQDPAGENRGDPPGLAETTPVLRAISQVDTLVAVDAPDSNVTVAALDRSTDFGSARVLLVEETAGDWVRVQLPIRPNATSGWVRATEVSLEPVPYSVHVDLERRVLQVIHEGDLVLQSEVAIGSDDHPTPRGTFFITDKISTPDPGGAYGPFALGLSGHSETLTEFAGGDGQIGIHGTNDPSSIGQNVSHGCIRLANDVIVELAGLLPLGTPVTVA